MGEGVQGVVGSCLALALPVHDLYVADELRCLRSDTGSRVAHHARAEMVRRGSSASGARAGDAKATHLVTASEFRLSAPVSPVQ